MRRPTDSDPKPRILLICPQAFLINRGTPLSIVLILEALTELGYDVDMVTTHLGEDRQVEGAKIHRIPKIPFIRTMPPGVSFAKFVIMPFVLFLSWSLMLRQKHEFIVGLEDGTIYGGFLGRLFNKKVIYKVESIPTEQAQVGSLVHKLLHVYENVLFKAADVILPILDTDADYVRSRLPRDSNKGIVVVEAMPAFRNEVVSPERVLELRAQLNLDPEDVVVLWIGNLAWYQGSKLLRDTISQMSVLSEEDGGGTRIKFLVTGVEEEVRELFQGKQYPNLVVYEPSIDDMPNLVALGDICVSFRNIDVGFPSKVLVFLRAGKPIVAINTRSHCCHLSDRENSYLIDFDSSQACRDIQALAKDPEERRRIGANAKRYFDETFSWERYRSCWKAATDLVVSHDPTTPGAGTPDQ